MNTQARIRLFAGTTAAVLVVITGWGLSTNAGRQPPAPSSGAPVAVVAPSAQPDVPSAQPTAAVAVGGEFGEDEADEQDYEEHGYEEQD